MAPDTRVHKVKKGSKNPPPKPREAAFESQQQQTQHKTDPQQRNVAPPATSSPTEARPQEHPSSASWMLHDIRNVSDPIELMFIAGLYITVFFALALNALKYVVGPLMGDYIDLPFVTMEEGNVGIVKEFDKNPITVMWCMCAFTTFNYVLGLIMEERGGVVRLIRLPVAVFRFLFSGFIDMLRVEEWSPAQLTAYKHMRDRGRAENWTCFKKFLRVGLVWEITILCRALQRLWQEWRWNYNIDFLMKRNHNIHFLKIFRRKEREQEREEIPVEDCDTKKKPQEKRRQSKMTKQDVLKQIRERGIVSG